MTDTSQWIQPLFMVYDLGTDEKIPLTQERLDQLIAAERQYGMLITDIRRSHAAFAAMRGYTPPSFAGFEE